MPKKPLNKVDRIMWDADAPGYPNSICGMMTFKKKLNRKKILEILEARLLQYDRFKSCVVLKKDIPHWEKLKDFELHKHIQFFKLKKNEGYTFLQKEIGHMMSLPLDTNVPLWDARVYDHFEGGSSIVFRLHHAIADGAALISVLFSLTADSAKGSLEIAHQKRHFSWNDIRLVRNIRKFIHQTDVVVDEAKNLIQHPESIKKRLKLSYEVMKDASAIISEKENNVPFYKGEFSEVKLAAWSSPVDLQSIKQLGKKYDATVNDALLALMAGAVRRHLIKHEQDVSEPMRIVIPVNMREKTDDVRLHNEIGMISLELPIHLTTFLRRLEFIHEKTTLLKDSPEPYLLSKLMESVADHLPKMAKNALIKYLSTKFSASITNVPGPQGPVYFAGQQIEDIYCWIPHTAPLGVGLSLISYNGKVTNGMVIDQNMADDPDYVVKAFERELKDAVRKYLR